jgi:hypothetical protein
LKSVHKVHATWRDWICPAWKQTPSRLPTWPSTLQPRPACQWRPGTQSTLQRCQGIAEGIVETREQLFLEFLCDSEMHYCFLMPSLLFSL